MTCSNATKNWPSNSESKSVSHLSTYARSKPGYLRITETTSSRSRRPSRDNFHHNQVFERHEANVNSGNSHHLAALNRAAFVFRQGEHEVDANVGFRVQNGKDKRLFQKSVNVVDDEFRNCNSSITRRTGTGWLGSTPTVMSMSRVRRGSP